MSDPKDSSDNVPFLADYLANLVPADDLEDHSDDVAPLPRFVEHIFPTDDPDYQRKLELTGLNEHLKYPHGIMKDEPLSAAIVSLLSVLNYLSRSGIEQKLLRPLTELEKALDDLSHGIKNSLLEVPLTKSGDGRPPANRLSREYASQMALAAAAITLSGQVEPKKKTEQRAAMKLQISQKVLKDFRHNIAYQNTKDAWATFLYRVQVDAGKNASPESRMEIIESILKSLRPFRTV